MVLKGYAPSVRLFEAAACGVPVISDSWEGLDTFFCPGKEILIASSPEDVLGYLVEMDETDRKRIGDSARSRILGAHTAAHRVKELETYVMEVQ
jgi:spore maturation protein CgeB